MVQPPKPHTPLRTRDITMTVHAHRQHFSTNTPPTLPLEPEVAKWASQRVIVLVDADQFFQSKHMQRCNELPPGFEIHFFSCALYPSGAKKPQLNLQHVTDFCAQAEATGSRQARHWITQDTTKDAADRVMLSSAREMHATEHDTVPFLYVTNDRLLAKELGHLLSRREAVRWKHLHLRRDQRDALITVWQF